MRYGVVCDAAKNRAGVVEHEVWGFRCWNYRQLAHTIVLPVIISNGRRKTTITFTFYNSMRQTWHVWWTTDSAHTHTPEKCEKCSNNFEWNWCSLVIVFVSMHIFPLKKKWKIFGWIPHVYPEIVAGATGFFVDELEVFAHCWCSIFVVLNETEQRLHGYILPTLRHILFSVSELYFAGRPERNRLIDRQTDLNGVLWSQRRRRKN